MKIIEPQINPITPINGKDALLTIQRVAKTCYKTYKDSDDIESAKRIVKQLIDSGHHSMLEFYNITMNYVSNVAAYKDLTRHRHTTFAIESTRYCNYSMEKYNNEIRFLKPIEIKEGSPEYLVWKDAMVYAEKYYLEMSKLGAKPDQLSLVLPHSTAAEFNISANLREWRHILNLRAANSTGHARPCVNEIMQPTLEMFHKEIPVVFDDIYEKMIKNTKQR